MKIFIDSCILIEYTKGRGVQFFNFMVDSYDLLINQVVTSEYLYKYIGIKLQKAPLTSKVNGTVQQAFTDGKAYLLLKHLHYLPCNNEITISAIDLMKKYNLLPNDALILATCIANNIEYLATYDSDFEIPCIEENIAILNNLSQL